MWQQFELFHWARCRAPLSFGVVCYQRELHSCPTCGSGIWSWWLYDSLGWGIAVSAEEVTESWSVTIFLDRPIRAQKLWDGTSAQLKGLLPALLLLITAHHFFLSLRKRKMGRHSRTVALRNDLLCHERLISRNKKRKKFSGAAWKRGSISSTSSEWRHSKPWGGKKKTTLKYFQVSLLLHIYSSTE